MQAGQRPLYPRSEITGLINRGLTRELCQHLLAGAERGWDGSPAVWGRPVGVSRKLVMGWCSWGTAVCSLTDRMVLMSQRCETAHWERD